MSNSSGKYMIGTTVFAKAIPDEPLIIRRFSSKSYYCKLADGSDPEELVYFENELMSLQEKRDQA